MCILIGLIVILYHLPSKIVIGGQDPSVHVAAAVTLAETGGFELREQAHTELNEMQMQSLLGRDASSAGYIWPYAGVYYKNASNTLYTSFPKGPSYLLALEYLLSGKDAAFYSNILYCLLSLVTFFHFCRFFLPNYWPLLATLLLALSPPELWFGRATYSEVPSQFLLFFAFFHFALATGVSQKGANEEDTAPKHPAAALLIAVLATGCAVMMRIDQAIVLFILLVLAPWLTVKAAGAHTSVARNTLQARNATHSDSFARHLPLLLLQLSLAVIGYCFYTEIGYFTETYLPGNARSLPFGTNLGTWLIAILLISCVSYLPRLRAMIARALTIVRNAVFSQTGLMVFSLLIASVLTWGLCLRTQLFPKELMTGVAHIEGVRSMNEEIFHRLGIIVGAPIFILSFWGGYHFLKNRAAGTLGIIFTASVAVYALILLHSQLNSPMLYWASRRYLPLVVPGLILFGCYQLQSLSLFSRPSSNRIARGWLYALSLAPMLYVSYPLIRHAEMDGALRMPEALRAHFDPESTVLLSDAAAKHTNFTLRYFGAFEVLQIPQLDQSNEKIDEVLPEVIAKLQGAGYTVVLVSTNPTSPKLGALSEAPIQSIEGNYVRVGEPMDTFPRQIHTIARTLYFQKL